jgi:CHASE2 domain-containing sensor protein
VTASAAPYVGLDHFDEEDKDLFFGRDDDRQRIIHNLRALRLTILYAESGVGKTSLLHAGVSARLHELAARSVEETGSPHWLPFVFSGWRQGSTNALIAELERASDLTLPRDALGAALAAVGEQTGATPLLILDRFEDVLFEREEDRGFDDELARCVIDPHLRANFLLSVREDALSLIAQRFKGLIPNVLGNYLHLDFLDEHAARDAVVGPIRAFNRQRPGEEAPREVEPALVEAVIDQVRRGRVAVGDDGGAEPPPAGAVRVETAYLQLVMRRLWDEELAAGSEVLRVSTLERLGGADRIVHAHLEDVMDRLPPDQADAAATAFRFLLTSAGRKIALSTTELHEFSDADASALEPALRHLERERILRPVPAREPGAAGRREIFHDVLAPAILQWRRRHVEDRHVRERTRRLEVRSRRLAATAIALAAVLAGMGLYLWSPGVLRRVELATVDARLALRGGRAPDPNVVLVAVDDRTLRALAGPDATVLPRGQHARLLHTVSAAAPAVVALDVIFEGPTDTGQDTALLRAMQEAGARLVLPYDPATARVGVLRDGTRVMRPLLLGLPDITRLVEARLGYAGLPHDVDGRVRRADYQVGFALAGAPDVSAPTLAFAAADVARRGALRTNLDDLPTAGRRAWGGQSESTTWIDTRWPAGTVRRVSALDLLRGSVPPGSLRGRSVVIGVVPATSEDVFRAPLDGGAPVPGAELHAEALATFLRGSPLRDARRVVEILTIVLMGALPALAFVALRRSLALAVVAAAAAAYLVAAQLAFHEGWVLIVAPPLAALLLAAAGINLLRWLRTRHTG